MLTTMTKKERCEAAIRGELPDRIPYSLWSHMPQYDLDAETIAKATYNFYKAYDIDFIKTMNNGMYSIEDFGCVIDYSDVLRGGIARLVRSPINEAADWGRLKVCSLHEGALARELKYLSILLDLVKDEAVPVILTVFSPVTTANKLCGSKLVQYIREGHAAEVRLALEVITRTTCLLVARAVELGADGIFMATQMSNYASSDNAMSEMEYLMYGKPYDIRILNTATDAGAWMNVLHCHGDNIMFDILKDYPAQVFNWHMGESLPTMEEALALTDKCLMGGLQRFDITRCNRNKIRNQIFQCFKLSGGYRLFLTPGCGIRYPLNDEMLSYVKRIKEEVERVILAR